MMTNDWCRTLEMERPTLETVIDHPEANTYALLLARAGCADDARGGRDAFRESWHRLTVTRAVLAEAVSTRSAAGVSRR